MSLTISAFSNVLNYPGIFVDKHPGPNCHAIRFGGIDTMDPYRDQAHRLKPGTPFKPGDTMLIIPDEGKNGIPNETGIRYSHTVVIINTDGSAMSKFGNTELGFHSYDNALVINHYSQLQDKTSRPPIIEYYRPSEPYYGPTSYPANTVPLGTPGLNANKQMLGKQ